MDKQRLIIHKDRNFEHWSEPNWCVCQASGHHGREAIRRAPDADRIGIMYGLKLWVTQSFDNALFRAIRCSWYWETSTADTVHKIFNILNLDNTEKHILKTWRFHPSSLHVDVNGYESYSIQYFIPFNKSYEHVISTLSSSSSSSPILPSELGLLCRYRNKYIYGYNKYIYGYNKYNFPNLILYNFTVLGFILHILTSFSVSH